MPSPLQDWFTRLLARRLPIKTARKISAPVSTAMFFTLAAQLTTLPIMAYQFGRISLVSIDRQSFYPAGPAGSDGPGRAWRSFSVSSTCRSVQLVAWVAWPFAAYTDRAVEFFNRLPHGVIVLGDFSFLFVVLFFGIFAVLDLWRGACKTSFAPCPGSFRDHHCPGRNCLPGLVCLSSRLRMGACT